MLTDLNGVVAFITGAASGIGLGMSRAFAQAGAKIAMVDVNEDAVVQAAASLQKGGATVLALPLDVTNYDGWSAAAERVETSLGPVQLLCNNAGISVTGQNLETMLPEHWLKLVDVNLNSVFYGVRCFVGRMKAAGGGHIVNTASMAGLIPTPPGMTAYGATKFAVVGLSESLRAELAPDGIGVSVVCPAAVRSELWRTSRRIRGLPDIEVPPPESLRNGSASTHALDPFLVGLATLNAVRTNELYVLTHPEYRKDVDQRLAQLLASFDRAEAGRPNATQYIER